MSTTTIQINETDIEETIIKETIPNLSIIEKKSSVVFAETLESEPQTPTETLIDDFDGGYGWLVVFGAFFFQLTSFGVEMSIMQDYYYQHIFNESSSQLVQLSFVGTITIITINGMSPLTQMLVSIFGLRPVMLAGTILIAISLELAGFSTEIWHLYLTQGLLFGIGASFIFVNCVAIPPQWFTRNKSVAMGIISGGTGIGGVVVPFIMTSINQTLGPAWTYRILGFICFACALNTCVWVKERVPQKRERKKFNEIIQFGVLRNKNYLLFIIAANLALFGNFIPYFYLPSYATFLGLSESQGSALVAVASGSNFIGRITVGLQADRVGCLNSFILFNLIASLSSFLIWTFATNYGILMAFAIIFGFTSGSYFVLVAPIFTTILPINQFYSGLTLAFLTNVIPVFGTNIASAIQEGINTTPFFTYKMFTGVAYLLGAIVLLYLKLKVNKNVFARI